MFVLALLIGVGGTAQAQSPHAHHGDESAAPGEAETVLQAPGASVFGAVQEAIRALEADSTTDWSAVDVDQLRQHLLDMHRVALHVEVEEKSPLDDGVRIRVRPTTDEARASLARVLDAHPHMLKQETGWTMAVEEQEATYVLRVTTGEPDEAEKIQGLGYMGLLAYGTHHQRHHWHLVRGQHPHDQGGM